MIELQGTGNGWSGTPERGTGGENPRTRRYRGFLVGVFLVLGAVAFGQNTKSKIVLPKPTELKGSLAPMPMLQSDNTQTIVAQIKNATEKGRALYQAQESFDESYRGFMKVVQFLQDKRQPSLVCKSPEAASAYLAASKQLGEFQVLRLQFSAMLTPLREVPRQTLTPARKKQLSQVLTYEKEVAKLAPIIDGLFSEQMRGEIVTQGCKDESLRIVAKSKKGLVLPALKNAAKPNTLPPAAPQNAPFSVNNIDCSSPFVVFIDGAPIGTASANSTTSFSATNGAHSLCLAPADDPESCDDPSNNVESFIYDGWWVKAQCPE